MNSSQRKSLRSRMDSVGFKFAYWKSAKPEKRSMLAASKASAGKASGSKSKSLRKHIAELVASKTK